MQYRILFSLALASVATAATLPKTASKHLHPGFEIPQGPNGLYKHVVDPTTGEVTTTYLGDSNPVNATALQEDPTGQRLASIPPWPANTQITCTSAAYSVNHVELGAAALGKWCATHTLEENTNFSYSYYDVAVFVCNWAETITNDCSSGQLNTALQQSANDCGAGVTTSNAYFPWYKAYGIATPRTYVCKQTNLNPV